jgi:Bacterial Ig domain
MKKIIIILVLAAMIISPVFAQYYVRGTHNAWGTSGGELALKSGLGGDQYYGVTIALADSNVFKIANDDWSAQWSNHVTSFDTTTVMSWFGSNAYWVSPPLPFVHISVKNPNNYLNVDLPVGIMALSSDTITTISSVSDDHSLNASENDSVTVTITTSQPLLPEEKLYVRYSVNNWNASDVVLASGSDTTYTATIVPFVCDSVSYYILTTTLDWESANINAFDPDLLTLAYETNSSQNYKYYVYNNTAPQIYIIGDQSVEEGDTLELIIAAHDINSDPLTWSASGFGSGVDTTTTVDGNFKITFAPDYTQAGRVDTITVMVSDGINETTTSFVIDDKNNNSKK